MAKGDFHDPHDFSKSLKAIGFISWRLPAKTLRTNAVTYYSGEETFVWLYKYEMSFVIHNN